MRELLIAMNPCFRCTVLQRSQERAESMCAMLQALTAVAERVPDILAMGVPIPEMISFDKFNVFSDRRELDMYGKKKINHFGLDMELRKELNPLPMEENDQDAPAPWKVGCVSSNVA